jgi:hypothetical protein
MVCIAAKLCAPSKLSLASLFDKRKVYMNLLSIVFTYTSINGHADGWTVVWTNRQTGRQIEKQVYGQKNRQTGM